MSLNAIKLPQQKKGEKEEANMVICENNKRRLDSKVGTRCQTLWHNRNLSPKILISLPCPQNIKSLLKSHLLMPIITTELLTDNLLKILSWQIIEQFSIQFTH